MLKKDELCARLAEQGYTKKDANIILDDVFRVITEALIEGESVMIHGFGTFDVREHKERQMIDYQTQEWITNPAYKFPKFTAGQTLKRAIKEGFIRD